MKWTVAILLSTAVALAQAQENKVDRVWQALHARLERQNDYWFDKGEFPKTVQLLKFGADFFPTDGELVTNLGWMLENIDRYDEALAVYVRYKNDNPADKDSAWPEANFYFARKAYAKVIPLLEPTISKDPHANSYRTLAHSYERLNMLNDSKRIWETYLKKHPEDLTAKQNLDRVLKKLKEGSSKKS